MILGKVGKIQRWKSDYELALELAFHDQMDCHQQFVAIVRSGYEVRRRGSMLDL